jgi:arabinose-5-phosphate isomerase
MVGIITDGDVRRHMLTDERCLYKKASEIMTKNPRSIRPDQLATEGMHIVEVFKIGELPVLDDDGRPVGMLMMKDLFKAGIV